MPSPQRINSLKIGFVTFMLLSNLGWTQTPKIMTVAVNEFRAEGLNATEAWLGRNFADALIGDLSRSRQMRIVEREYLEKIMQEWALQQSGAVDENAVVEIGKLLGTQILVFGSVTKYENAIIARVRAVSVERGDILGSCEAQGNPNQLLQIQKKLGNDLAALLAVEKALANPDGLAEPELSVPVFETLDRLSQIDAHFPIIGQEPGHTRKQSEYYFALTLCDQVLSSAPKLSKALLYRGRIYLHLGDYARAQQDLLAAKAIAATGIEYDLALGNLYFLQRQYAESEKILTACVKSFPDDARGWYALGRLMIALSENTAAVKALLFALERSPEIAEAENNLRTLLRSPRNTEIIENLAKTNQGLHAVARLFLGVWAQQLREAFPYIKIALASHPNLYMTYYAAGLKSLAEGNKELALQQFKACLSLRPGYPPVHRELGQLALELGHRNEGKQHLNIYLKTAAHIADYDMIKKQLEKFP
ncbi:MAG: hypothetical protein ALAOOOJD_04167 [bacterium]|nr:hypothetical protein [bacterium]